MQAKNPLRQRRWILIGLVFALIVGGYVLFTKTELAAQRGSDNTANTAAAVTEPTTVAVQAASAVISEVSASGHIELVSEHYVMQDVEGEVAKILVNVGDEVQAGDLLLTLDTTELERAVALAELTVELQGNALAQLTEEAEAAEIAVAEANLTEAQENLADVLAGPSAEEIAAAKSSLAAAWASYSELQEGPSAAALTQLSADIKKTEVALAEAQRAYDQIAWRNDTGMTSEAATLQDATIDYESALAAYEESTAAADTSELQSALSAAQSAQATLDDLQNSPTAAEIATAEAVVTEAQATLEELVDGASTTEIRDAEISLESALIDLQVAYADLDAAKIYAPSAGTVLAINAEVGERITADGTAVITLADTSQLELTIDVAEVDIVQLAVGQAAEVEIDALSNQTFAGVIEYIAPVSDDTSAVVSYPVTIRLTDESLAGVLPGMTAVATIVDTNAAADSLLVPTSAILLQDGQSVVTVVTEAGSEVVEVLPGGVQGEWTVVQSADLAVGDQVLGSVTSYTSESESFGPPGGPPGGGMAPPVMR